MMKETDINKELDRSLFFVAYRVVAGWWLSVSSSLTDWAGETRLGLVFRILWPSNEGNDSMFEHSMYTWKCVIFNAESSFTKRNWPSRFSQKMRQKFIKVFYFGMEGVLVRTPVTHLLSQHNAPFCNAKPWARNVSMGYADKPLWVPRPYLQCKKIKEPKMLPTPGHHKHCSHGLNSWFPWVYMAKLFCHLQQVLKSL